MLAINIGKEAQSLSLGKAAQIWLMQAAPLDSGRVSVNGVEPTMDDKGRITGLKGKKAGASFAVPGESIAFAAIANANNPACK